MIHSLAARGTVTLGAAAFVVDENAQERGEGERVLTVGHEHLALIDATGEDGENDGALGRNVHGRKRQERTTGGRARGDRRGARRRGFFLDEAHVVLSARKMFLTPHCKVHGEFMGHIAG